MLLTLVTFAVPAFAAPPANDAFASRIILSGSYPITTTGTNVEATKQSGEPNHAGNAGGRSVWWTWTAPTSARYVIRTDGSSFDTTLGIYVGTAVNALTLIVGDDDAGAGSNSLVNLNAISGTTYQIAVDGYGAASGSIVLTIDPPPTPPANDSFADRVSLPGGATSFSATNTGATKESGEPNHGFYPGGASVWWSWTAPSTGEVGITTTDSSFITLIGVHTGSSVDALTTLVGSSYDYSRASFTAVAGTTYHIALDGMDGSTGNTTISITNPAPPPANDNFANRAPLTGSGLVKAVGTNLGATSEAGEPFHAGLGGGRSVWHTWTAPSTGSYRAYLVGSETFANRLLNVYTGSSVDALTSVGGISGYDSPLLLNFSATAGTVYQIAIDGAHPPKGVWSGTYVLTISQPPANDNFADAINLGSAASGLSTSWIDFSAGTETDEPGAPRFPWLPSPRTVWWKWTAPATGFFKFDTLGANFDTVLQVYTGSAVNALTLVAQNSDANTSGQSSLTIKATVGTTYLVRVSGETPDEVGVAPLQYSQLATSGSAADYVALGRAHLQQQTEADLASADTAFGNALSIDANHAEANLLKAFTTFAMLEQGAAFETVLAALGLTNSDVYARAWGIPKDGLGNRVLPPGTSTTAVAVNYLGNTMLPALTVIRNHLSKVSSPSFSLVLTDSETSDRMLLLDAGDISLIHACMHGLEAIIRLLQTYNAGVTVADVFTAVNNDTLSVKSVADSFTNLLTFTGNDQRTAFKTALQSANTHYQAGSTFVRTTRATQDDARHLFYLDVSNEAGESEGEIRDGLQQASNSLNGATIVGGETVNLAQAITSTKSLREQLMGLLGNKGVASTAPDPTFDGVVPNSTHAKVNRFLGRTGFLHSITSFSTWAAAFLGGQSVPNQAKGADPDKDMLTNFAEYAFNLNPGKSSGTQEYAVNSLQTNVSDGKKYLNLSFVRRIDRATIDYVVAVSDNLTTWDRTGTQLEQVGVATANADGVTETVTVRLLADPLVTSRKFVRLEVSEVAP